MKILFPALLLALICGCSSGPQVPVSTPVINIACTWSIMDGGTCTECICMIDRSSALSKPVTTGNEIPNAQVEIHTDTDVEPSDDTE